MFPEVQAKLMQDSDAVEMKNEMMWYFSMTTTDRSLTLYIY